MQRLGLLLGSGLVAALSVSAQAATLYDSGGFEASAGFVTGGFLIGQTGGTPTSTWAGTPTGPQATVGSYFGASGTNLQFVAVTAGTPNGAGVTPASGSDSSFFYPTTYSNSPYAATGQQVAIRWTMTTSSPTATSGSPFFGITATSDQNGTEIARLGLNNGSGANNGKLVGAPADGMFSGFTATPGTFYQYELLLDYGTQTYSVYTAPAGGSSAFTLRGGGAFETPATTFADADITTFSLDGNSYSGQAVFDNYSVTTVPEPVTLSVAGVAFGLLARRRSR